jgi:hypothetical protein
MSTGQRHKAALAAAQCEPNLSPNGLQCTTVQMLTAQYRAIADPVIQQVNTAAAAYTASETGNLASAEAALRAEVASEEAFGASLARFRFPPVMAATATALINADHICARLTSRQAQSTSLAQMRSLDGRVDAASAVVRAELTLITKALARPPTASQEP